MERNGKSGKKMSMEKFKKNSQNLGKSEKEKSQKIQIKNKQKL